MSENILAIGETNQFLLAAGLYTVLGEQSSWSSVKREFILSDETPKNLINLAIKEKMIPMLYEYIKSIGNTAQNDIESLNAIYVAISIALYDNFKLIVESLEHKNISILLLKGAMLDICIYKGIPIRQMVDIDFLIMPPSIGEILLTFEELCYIQGEPNLNTLSIIPASEYDKKKVLIENHQMVPFRKITKLNICPEYQNVLSHYKITPFLKAINNDVYFVVEYDAHINLGSDFDITDIWFSAEKLKLPTNQFIMAQSITDAIWFLCIKLYHEVMILTQPGIRNFIDIVAILNKHKNIIDWERIMHIAEKYELRPSLFYIFWHINSIVGNLIPDEIINGCRPTNKYVSRLHDWGDFMPKMLNTTIVTPILNVSICNKERSM